MFNVRGPKSWKYFVSTTILILFASGCIATSMATPTIFDTPTIPEQSTTPTQDNSSSLTKTPEPLNPPTSTFTISPSETGELPGESTATGGSKTYPEVSTVDLYDNPDEYDGKRFMLNGVIVKYGKMMLDGKEVFVVQVGVLDYPRPIIVLGVTPNPRLATHDGIILGGTGGGAIYGIDPLEPNSFVPVIFGEWYECNIPLDLREYPPDYWIPFQ